MLWGGERLSSAQDEVGVVRVHGLRAKVAVDFSRRDSSQHDPGDSRSIFEFRARTPRPVELRPGCSSNRSEEHTSELQSPCNIVCRLLLENLTAREPLTVDHIPGQAIQEVWGGIPLL